MAEGQVIQLLQLALILLEEECHPHQDLLDLVELQTLVVLVVIVVEVVDHHTVLVVAQVEVEVL